MTETTTPATQAEIDQMTHDLYLDCGKNKAETARQLEINASTVAARIKRHLARAEAEAAAAGEDAAAIAAQDAAGEPAAETAEATCSRCGTSPLSESEAYHGKCDPCQGAAEVEQEQAETASLEDDETGETGEAAEAPEATEGQAEALKALPAINGDDYLAYLIHCNSPGCGAEPYHGCRTGHRSGKQVLMGYAHPVRISEAKAARTAGRLTVPENLVPERKPAEPAPAEPAAAGTPGHEDHGDHGHESGAGEPAKAGDGKERVTECVDCGFKFSRPQVRKTCKSVRACGQRQAENAAKATAQ